MKVNVKLLKKDVKDIAPAAVLIILALFIFDRIFGTVCPFRIITGIPCPGCGVTRAFIRAFHMDFVGATKMHLFWIPLAILAIAFVIIRYFVQDSLKRNKYLSILWKITIVVLVLSVVFYIYRMITVFPGPAPMEDDHMWFRAIPR